MIRLDPSVEHSVEKVLGVSQAVFLPTFILVKPDKLRPRRQWEESERSAGGGEFQSELFAEAARHGRKERFRGTGTN